MPLDLSRAIAYYRNQPEHNFLAIALQNIQANANAPKATTAAAPAVSTPAIVASPAGNAPSVSSVNGITGAVTIVGPGVASQPASRNILIASPVGGVNVQTGVFTVTAVAAGTGVYTGLFPGGTSGAYVGQTFVIAGFVNGANNGSFACTASTTSTLTLVNSSSVAETHAATATGNIYAATSADSGMLLAFNSSSGLTYLLSNPAPPGNWFVGVECVGSGGLTINPNGLDIDTSGSNLTLSQNSGLWLFSDKTNFWTLR